MRPFIPKSVHFGAFGDIKMEPKLVPKIDAEAKPENDRKVIAAPPPPSPPGPWHPKKQTPTAYPHICRYIMIPLYIYYKYTYAPASGPLFA